MDQLSLATDAEYVDVMDVGIIGARGHSQRIYRIISLSKNARIKHVYLPHRKPDIAGGTQSFDDLLSCQAVFILSPSDTHFDYLQKLGEQFNGYVFCEKPPVTSIQQFDQLRIRKDKTFFNFNYRFSGFRRAYDTALAAGELGEVFHFYSVSSQGLAFKDDYPGTWRADKSRHPHGVTETKSIHMIDLAIALFGNYSDVSYWPVCISGRGTASDTSHTVIAFDKGRVATIMSSYSAPFSMCIRVIGTNGILEYSGEKIFLISPRDVFDESGLFVQAAPKVLRDYKTEHIDFYRESLEESVSCFLDHVENRTTVSEQSYDAAMRTNRLLLELKETVC